MNHKSKIAILGAVLAFFALSAESCDTAQAPDAGSDSQQKYAAAKIPVDTKIYTISGEVAGQINSVTRQVKPASGSLSGSSFGGYGSVSGSYFGPVEAGKGFVRLLVSSSDATNEAPEGDLVVLKVSDTKATALVEGDRITFKCRRQYENIAAVQENETLNVSDAATWELDYCRLVTPRVDVK